MIKVSNLTKKFHDFTAVDNISFEVNDGEFFAFLGPNGAGKSTTIKMLTTLLDPTDGEIEINGIDPKENEGAVRKQFGIVFQDPSLDDDLTALENLEFHAVIYNVPDEKKSDRIDSLLNMVELSDRKNDLVKNFSGGMKRRLEIARGLLHHPMILFLDEPTLGLDPQTRNKMWDYIKQINKEEQMTVFFTTHYMEEAAKMADRIAIIDHGMIIAVGTEKELEKDTGKNSLEEAFLDFTGREIREEQVTGLDHLRQRSRLWNRRR